MSITYGDNGSLSVFYFVDVLFSITLLTFTSNVKGNSCMPIVPNPHSLVTFDRRGGRWVVGGSFLTAISRQTSLNPITLFLHGDV